MNSLIVTLEYFVFITFELIALFMTDQCGSGNHPDVHPAGKNQEMAFGTRHFW